MKKQLLKNKPKQNHPPGKLRPYRIWLIEDGPEKEPLLVFAYNRAEAVRMAYRRFGRIGIGAKWEKAKAVERMRQQDTPHFVLTPDLCPRCKRWGGDPVMGQFGFSCTKCENQIGFSGKDNEGKE